MTIRPTFEQLAEEALAQPFLGWDFNFVVNRIEETDPEWNYRSMVIRAIADSTGMLDLCTGGGEFLDGLAGFPATTVATEGFAPNVPIARERLGPRGIGVVHTHPDGPLPFTDGSFDLIVNRHGAFSAPELKRVAKHTGARFITQQVGSANARGINRALHGPEATSPPWTLANASAILSSAGFEITSAAEQYLPMTFRDVGALIYYLKAIPWQVPDFDFSVYRQALAAIHNQIESTGAFTVTAHRFVLEATI